MNLRSPENRKYYTIYQSSQLLYITENYNYNFLQYVIESDSCKEGVTLGGNGPKWTPPERLDIL
jgi:hypothetical protein